MSVRHRWWPSRRQPGRAQLAGHRPPPLELARGSAAPAITSHIALDWGGGPIWTRAPLRVRISVYLRRSRIDRRIAEGSPCGLSQALTLRAHQLVDPRHRLQVARGLRSVVAYVDRVAERRVLVSAVVIDRAAVGGDREAILGLAERLEQSAPVSPRGVVLARVLLTDGASSPLFNARCARSVGQAVWEVADALGADAPSSGGPDLVVS